MENKFPFIPNAPVYGDFSALWKLRQQQALVSSVTNVEYDCGYYDYRTGGFSPVPVPHPTLG